MSNSQLLRALSEALEDPQALLAVILDSEDREAAMAALQERYGWDEVQAMTVLDMQFRRATRADRVLIMQEFERAQD